MRMIDDLPEVSKAVDLAGLKDTGTNFKVEFSEQQLSKIAEKLDLVTISSFASSGQLIPLTHNKVRMTAKISADVVQACSISLKDVSDHIEEEFAILFMPEENIPSSEEEMDIDLEEEDIEPLPDDVIDVSEHVLQQLSLSLNPYPRYEGAKGDELGVEILQENDTRLEANKKNPFAVLKSLQHKA